MNIKCLKCETLYELPILKDKESSYRLKCSVCGHEWDHKVSKKSTINKQERFSFKGLKKLIILNLALVLLAVSSIIIFRESLESTNIFWRNLYFYFDELIPIQ